MADLGFRYARSADGISIAYARLGSGPPLVVDRGEAARAFNPLMRGLMRFTGIELVVRFDGLDQAAVD
jgi:hypothetical protein